jgi:hypothetical protein
MVGFTVSRADKESTKDLLDAFAHFRLGTITDQLVHHSPFLYVVFYRVNKFLVCFQTIYICYQGFTPNKDLSCFHTAIDCFSITEDGICSNRLIPAFNIAGREPRTPMLFQCIRDSTTRILCGHIKGALDGISWSPTKERTKQLKLWSNLRYLCVMNTINITDQLWGEQYPSNHQLDH